MLKHLLDIKDKIFGNSFMKKIVSKVLHYFHLKEDNLKMILQLIGQDLCLE